MNRAALLTLLWLTASFAAHRAIAAQLSYTLYVVGLPVADAVLGYDTASADYRLGFRFHTTGLADLFAGDSLDEHINGRFEGDRPAPLDYASNGRIHGRERVVAMTWRDGGPVLTSINPPNEGEREDVPAALRARTIDPLSSIVMLINLVARTGRCEGSARTYDGRRLQLFEVWTAGEEEVPPTSHSSFSGRGLRCDFTDQTLAGFRLGAGRDDDLRTHRGTIWLSRISPGTAPLPVRASIETRFLGHAMIYLTSVSP